MQLIPFAPFFSRVSEITGLKSQTALARALGVNRSAITQAKLRNAVPHKWILSLSRKYNVSPDWLEFGLGTPHATRTHAKAAQKTSLLEQVTGKKLSANLFDLTDNLPFVTNVPKVAATLCAGGGSFEVVTTPKDTQPFPTSWLSRMGSPTAMVLMDVVGTSMEPTIFDGDTVLIDQSQTALFASGIWAVGVEDAIFIKRMEKKRHSLALLSDNQEYAPILLAEDELNSFRIIGKVIWLCRDCRFI